MSFNGTISDVPVVISVADQESMIATNLNSSMFLNFIMGIYTMVYFCTMYLYLRKPKPTQPKDRSQTHPKNLSIPIALTALYTLTLLNFSIEWYILKWDLVDNGDTRLSTFMASFGYGSNGEGQPLWMLVALNVTLDLLIVVSDGLLLWRCFHLWNGSWRVIALPLFLTSSEFAITIPLAYLAYNGSPNVFNSLSSAFMFISAASTSITTFLMGLRIYRTLNLSFIPTPSSSESSTGQQTKHKSSEKHMTHRPSPQAQKSRKRFTKIFQILFESAALYAAIVLINAIFTAIPDAHVQSGALAYANYYFAGLLPVSAGLAPTILVARIITSRSEESDTIVSISHISGMHFDNQDSHTHSSTTSFDGQHQPQQVTSVGYRSLDLEVGTRGEVVGDEGQEKNEGLVIIGEDRL